MNLKISSSTFLENKNYILVILASTLITIIFLYFSLMEHNRKDEYENVTQEIEKIFLLKNQLKKQNLHINEKNSEFFKLIEEGPKTKTELTAIVTSLAVKSQIQVIKLSSSESIEKNNINYIDIEIAGSFLNIKKFLSQLDNSIGASTIKKVKVTSGKQSSTVNVLLNIQFNPAITLHALREKYFREALNDRDYYFDYFDAWKPSFTQFVQADAKQSNTESSVMDQEKLRNPFESGEDKNTSVKAEATPSKPDTEITGRVSDKYYLSGILFSKRKKICFISIPGGETKIFEDGAYINQQTFVTIMNASQVRFNSIKDKSFKVGDQIPL
jgi:hypothetical protein